jgi:hypothetical protein
MHVVALLYTPSMMPGYVSQIDDDWMDGAERLVTPCLPTWHVLYIKEGMIDASSQ